MVSIRVCFSSPTHYFIHNIKVYTKENNPQMNFLENPRTNFGIMSITTNLSAKSDILNLKVNFFFEIFINKVGISMIYMCVCVCFLVSVYKNLRMIFDSYFLRI